MPKDDLLEFEGTVNKACGGGQYEVITAEGNTMKAKLNGKMKMKHIQVIVGDRIRVGVSPYDLTHGMIIWRYR
jgi:translation initiation factor IF-1